MTCVGQWNKIYVRCQLMFGKWSRGKSRRRKFTSEAQPGDSEFIFHDKRQPRNFIFNVAFAGSMPRYKVPRKVQIGGDLSATITSATEAIMKASCALILLAVLQVSKAFKPYCAKCLNVSLY